MKKFRHILIILLLINASLLKAQAPQGFKYQTSVRDNSGNLLANKLVAIKLSLIKDSAYGTTVYSEKFNVSTNDFGIANLNVGSGSVLQGTFASINWNTGSFFLKIDMDMNNGTNFQYMGTSQLLSVPFAMYATKSGSSVDDGDKDPTNEIQTLSVAGNKLNLSQANQVNIDADTTNELQQLTLTNDSLKLSKNGGITSLSRYMDNTDSQTLSLQGRTLSITRGNSLVLTGAIDLDADPTNELQKVTLHGDTLGLTRDTSFVLLIDNDTLNEIQTLNQTGNSVSLSKNGGSVDVAKTTNVQNGSILYASASGTNNIALTLSPIPTSYTPGMIVNFKTVATNTASVTVNLNGLGAKPLLKNVTDTLIAGDMVANQMASIIYDGNNFQFLVAPYARTANKANKLNSDSSGGLIPQNGIISTQNISPASGYTYTGQSYSSTVKITVVNSDYSNTQMKYIGNYNNQFLFINQLNPIMINKFDTSNNTWTNLTTFSIPSYTTYTNYNGFKSFYAMIIGNSVFILYTHIVVNGGNNSPILSIREYNLNTNSWSVRYDNMFGSITTDPGFYLYNVANFNNNLYMNLSINYNNYLLNNSYDSSTFYRFSLSTNTFTRINPKTSFNLNVINNNVYNYNGQDSIYKLLTNESWQYINKVPKTKLSSANAILGNNWIIGEFRFNALTNNQTQRSDYSPITSGKIFGSNVYISQPNFYYGDTISFIFKPINIDPTSVNVNQYSDFFTSNSTYLWGMFGGMIFKMDIPQTYYYHRKL